jgi:hypothetical protein
VNPLFKALKDHPEAPSDDDVFHYGKQKDWARKVKEIGSRRSPLVSAAASEGARRLSVTPTQPPIGASKGNLRSVSMSSFPRNLMDATAQAPSNIGLLPQPSASSQNALANQTAHAPTTSTVVVPDATSVTSTLGADLRHPQSSASSQMTVTQAPATKSMTVADPIAFSH